MSVIGCIMEINPPHHGHRYYLSQIPKKQGDIIVVVCSTTLVQRGEITVINKHEKARWLLKQGADIVVELPGIFANQGGFYFAKNAIEILKAFEVTDLYFGSESSDLNYLQEFVSKLPSRDFDFKNGIYKSTMENLNSNDILGISYLQNIGDSITPHLIKRIKNNYNDEVKNDSPIQSATFIRKNINNPEIKNYVDQEIYDQLHSFDINQLFPTFRINLEIALRKNLNIFLSESRELLYRFANIFRKHDVTNFEELLELAQDKNNSKHKLRRVIINVILLVEQSEVESISSSYLRVLGLTSAGSNYIKEQQLNVITSLKETDSLLAKYEITLSKIYNLLTKQNINHDFLPPVVIKNSCSPT